MTNQQDDILGLLRLGIGHHLRGDFQTIEWSTIKALAERQGLSAIIIDGIGHLPEALRPPKKEFLQLIGEVLQGYEYRFELYRRSISEIAAFYNSHGYKMMVLKGYACAVNWPKPEHRPCGDIDIWLFGKQKEADADLIREKGIQVDKSHHHHTMFLWRDFMVENHYDFINIYHHSSNSALERVFKELGQDSSNHIVINGEKVCVPAPNMHALFLLKHTMSHFASSELTLRQLLDWGFFVEKHTKEVDWKWLEGVLDEYGMTPAFNIFNAICVEDLGFDSCLFPLIQFNPLLKDKVLSDIINPSFGIAEPRGLISRLLYKYRRWKANEWKHKLCYNESMWSAFWSGLYTHLCRPSSANI